MHPHTRCVGHKLIHCSIAGQRSRLQFIKYLFHGVNRRNRYRTSRDQRLGFVPVGFCQATVSITHA